MDLSDAYKILEKYYLYHTYSGKVSSAPEFVPVSKFLTAIKVILSNSK